jgi:hypothetical protein
MARSRKGWRRIVVEGAEFYWLARGTDDGIYARVVGPEAFVSGQHGQELSFGLSYYSVLSPTETGWRTKQRTAITPGVVRRAIDLARARQPAFTGRIGEPDVMLSEEEARALMTLTPSEQVVGDLARAEAVLARVESGEARAIELLLGIVLALGRTLHHARSTEAEALAVTWARERAARLVALAPAVQSYVRDLEATLAKEWPEWQRQRERCCERRSAVEFLLDLCRRAGLPELPSTIDTRTVDAHLLAPKPAIVPEPDFPASHAWWFVGRR